MERTWDRHHIVDVDARRQTTMPLGMQAMTPTPLERRSCDTKLDLSLVRSDCIAVDGVSVRTMLLHHSITTGSPVLVEQRKLDDMTLEQ